MEQKPTIGRIVHVADEKGTTCAAIVTAVHNETCINVTRFNPDGSTSGVANLQKVHYPPKGTLDWNWPSRD
ncbi:hypothetical protein Bb109J_c1930 [Bdellovibrio bacteriovorus]|nr:hypothetical protein Bb109J_c1930 [Bdellovibrio bacteriovorus]